MSGVIEHGGGIGGPGGQALRQVGLAVNTVQHISTTGTNTVTGGLEVALHTTPPVSLGDINLTSITHTLETTVDTSYHFGSSDGGGNDMPTTVPDSLIYYGRTGARSNKSSDRPKDSQIPPEKWEVMSPDEKIVWSTMERDMGPETFAIMVPHINVAPSDNKVV